VIIRFSKGLCFLELVHYDGKQMFCQKSAVYERTWRFPFFIPSQEEFRGPKKGT
jgi:hypothetical protein